MEKVKSLYQQRIETELKKMTEIYLEECAARIKLTEQYDKLQENYHKVCALKMEKLINSLPKKFHTN